MLRKLSNGLRTLTATPFVLFPTLILAFYTFNLLNVNVISKLNIPMLDSYLTGYGKKEAIQTLELLGPKGREIYLLAYTQLYDVIFPILLSIILTSMLSKTYPLFGQSSSINDLFNLLPIGGLVFDLLENYCHYEMLINYPSSSIDAFIRYGGQFCFIKYVCFAITLSILIFGFFANIILFIKQVLSSPSNNNRNNNKNK